MNIGGWPFPISVAGDLAQGLPAFVEVECPAPMTKENSAILGYVVDSFVALGVAGALGGDRVSPLKSSLIASGDARELPASSGWRWDFSAVAIDPRALAVLFNALAFLVKDVARVAIETQGRAPDMQLVPDTLPPPWSQVPFDVDDDRTGPGVELRIGFARPLTGDAREAAEDALQTWLDCGSIQGYRDPAAKPDASLLAPCDNPAFDVDGDEVTARLEDSGVLDGAYDILVNLLVKLDALARIDSVELG